MSKSVAIISKNITPSVLEELKAKFGKLQIITVVVEQEEYDIDDLSDTTIAFLVSEKIDVMALRNRSLSVAERMASVDAYCAILPAEHDDDGNKELLRKQDMMRQMVQGIVTYEGEKYQFVVRRPDRGHIKMLLPLAEAKKLDDFSDKAVKNLVVGGDVDSLEDGIVFMGVVSNLKSMIAPAFSFLSKA